MKAKRSFVWPAFKIETETFCQQNNKDVAKTKTYTASINMLHIQGQTFSPFH